MLILRLQLLLFHLHVSALTFQACLITFFDLVTAVKKMPCHQHINIHGNLQNYSPAWVTVDNDL